MDKETQEKIQELQGFEQNLNGLLMQKQAFQMEQSETGKALEEIKNSKDDVFKLIGNIMVKTDKKKIEEELSKKKELIDLRLKTIESQESDFSKKAEELKKTFSDLEIVDWGEIPEFNMIINTTSLGLNKDDEIKLDYENIGSNKFFYDVIYNPRQTKFLSKAKQFGNQIENGKMMFIYQAHQAFTIWHKIMPKIDDKTIKLLD